MNLPPRNLVLTPLEVKDKIVLALDTGFAADSLEGMRLVKASRGSGWLYHHGQLSPWTTRGVLQVDGRLVVWGDSPVVPEGATPALWPFTAEEGREFLMAFVMAWTSRAGIDEPLAAFTASSLVPYLTPLGWSFAFLPPELAGVLDSLQPLADRLPWDHFRLPEISGPASWAFTSAALAWNLVEGTLPWAQDEEAHLRQEIRDLKKTLSEDELPEGPDPETLRLWWESLTGRLPGASAPARWKAWASGQPLWSVADDSARAQRRSQATAKRVRRRSGASFWRRKGTLTMALAVAVGLVLAIGGSMLWGALQPHPTDDWSPRQVVEGYYQAMSDLDADTMKKLASFDSGKEVALARDQDEVSNIYVIRQVRTAYEHESPVVAAQAWEGQGRLALEPGQILYGVAGLEAAAEGTTWKVSYRKWVSDSEEGKPPVGVGFAVNDRLTLKQTGKGWKIFSLERQRQPLP